MTIGQLELPLFPAGVQKCVHCSGVVWQCICTGAWKVSTWSGETAQCQENPAGVHEPVDAVGWFYG